MSKKRKQPKCEIDIIHEPYRRLESDTMTEFFNRYIEDENAVCEINGLKYFRAVYVSTFCINKRKGILAVLSTEMNLKINDVIIDDVGNEYTVKGFEMIRFVCDVPDWYFKVIPTLISPKYENVGEYFAVKSKSEECSEWQSEVK